MDGFLRFSGRGVWRFLILPPKNPSPRHLHPCRRLQRHDPQQLARCRAPLGSNMFGDQGGCSMIFVGDDWAEDHHDVHLMDEAGKRLASRRLPEGLTGISRLHELIGEHADQPNQVVIGIETDRGLWADALAAAGYQVYAINPRAVTRYRDRHHVSGAKSDASDAKLLADLVRTDRHNHRPMAGDSAEAEAIKVLARA